MTAVDHVVPQLAVDGPCDGWQLDPDACGDCDAFQGLTQPQQEAVTAFAADVLWRRTGRRYGLCAVTVRPCRDDCPTYGAGWPARLPGSTSWTNSGCGCAGPCSCGGAVAQVTLPGPVWALTEVTVDGAPLPDLQAAVRVDNWTTVVRQDGLPWPRCQHLGDPAPGSWSISYQKGRPVPAGGRWVLSRLVCELAKACAGQPCQLPGTATNVTRQGVTVTLPPVDVLVTEGLWGLPDVDQWITAHSQAPVRARPIVTPDVPTGRVQTWPLT